MRDNLIKNDSWSSPKIEVRGGSNIAGSGTFAKEDISKGEIVIIQGGKIIHTTEVDQPENQALAYHGFQIEKEFYIYPANSDESSLHGIFSVNHSCEPTCGFSGQITLVSMRDIKRGEEITYDYAMTDANIGEEWEDMDCLCQSDKCRGKITGDDWKIPELQERYRGYFSTYLEKIINYGI